MVENVKNRNGKEKIFYSDACRTRYHSRARELGHEILANALDMRMAKRAALLPVRIRRAEMVDLESMRPQERLGALCRAAEKMKVLSS